jgi:hypothetical protein
MRLTVAPKNRSECPSHSGSGSEFEAYPTGSCCVAGFRQVPSPIGYPQDGGGAAFRGAGVTGRHPGL